MGLYYSTPQDPLIALIVDREIHARQRLSRLLREIAPEFTGIVEATNEQEAFTKIERFTPNLLFLGSPLSPRLVEYMQSGPAAGVPKVILCKNLQKAQETIKTFGGYYLVKPVDAQHLRDLLDCLDGIPGKPAKKSARKNGTNGHSNGASSNGYLNRLVVRRQGQFRLLSVEKVVWFGTEFRLVYAYTERRRYPIDLGLEQLEHRLDPRTFVRVHRSAIVNLKRIKEIVPTSGGRSKILLNDPQERTLPLSASRAKPIKEIIRNRI